MEENRRRAEAEAARAKQQREHQEKMARMRKAEAEEKERRDRERAQREEENAQRKRDHEEKLKTMDAAMKAAAIKAEEERVRAQREYEERVEKERLAQLTESRDAAMAKMTEEVERYQEIIESDQRKLETERRITDESRNKKVALQKKLENFSLYKDAELKKKAMEKEVDLEVKKKAFYRTEEEIQSAIKKTGQTENNVGRFLELTHGLLGATLATTMDTNKMGAQIKTFDELINRECSDKLTIRQYADEEEDLKPLVQFFADDGKTKMRSLKCRGEEEFEEIISMLEEAAAKQLEENKEPDAAATDADDEKTEEVVSGEALLAKWGMSRYWKKMEEDGWDDPRDWHEMTTEDLKEVGFKGGHLRKWPKKIKELGGGSLLTASQKGLLREICFKPETWEKFEEAQEMAARSGLENTSPVLGTFFERIYGAVKESDKFLECSKEPSLEQMKAIEMAKEQPPPPDKNTAAEDRKEDADPKEPVADDQKEEAKSAPTENARSVGRKEWQKGSECEVYSEVLQKWCPTQIEELYVGDDGKEWLRIQADGATVEVEKYSAAVRPHLDSQTGENKLVLESYALREAAISALAITEDMAEQFKANKQTIRAETVALGVEDCTKQVMMSKANIRQSLLLAMAILDLKPSNMTDDAKPLWDAVDAGVVRLMESAIKMARASTDFFGYFLRFQSSFQYYDSNADKPLVVSLKYLRKDTAEFTVFQKKFMETVEALNKEAMQCIQNCVKQQGGAAAFQAARDEREKNQREYLAAQALYDQREVELESEYDVLQDEAIKHSAEEARSEANAIILDASIKQNTAILKDYEQRLLALKATVIQ